MAEEYALLERKREIMTLTKKKKKFQTCYINNVLHLIKNYSNRNTQSHSRIKLWINKARNVFVYEEICKICIACDRI